MGKKLPFIDLSVKVAFMKQEVCEHLLWKDMARRNEVCLIARKINVRSHKEFLHTHDYYELFYVLSGEGWHGINGRKRLLEPGMLVFIRPDDCHHLLGKGPGLEFINVSFSPSITDALLPSLRGGAAEAFKEVSQREMPWTLYLSARGREDFDSALEKLSRSARDELSSAAFYLNVLDIARESATKASEKAQVPLWLAQAVERIREPEIFRGGAAAFAALTGRSLEHAGRQTRRYYGCTPMQLIQRARLAYAAQQLEMGRVNISELAYACGYESLSHFIRLFHKQYGEAPLRYRRRRAGLA